MNGSGSEEYWPGDRVRITCGADLRGRTGTVRRHNRRTATVHLDEPLPGVGKSQEARIPFYMLEPDEETPTDVARALDALQCVASVACDAVLQHTLTRCPQWETDADPHVRVAGYFRALIRGELITKEQREAGCAAIERLPRADHLVGAA